MAHERILLVDDDPGWVELVRHWLTRAGYVNLESAGTGLQALQKAQDNPPDCILLDLVLPDQSGMEVCAKLRALPGLSRTPVVLLTGHKREKVLGLQNGADYFVAKDEKPHELLATLEAVFRRKQMEEGLLTRGDLQLRSRDRRVLWKGEPTAALTPKMFLLMHILVQRSPQPVPRAELFRAVEGAEEAAGVPSRALDVLLNRLRKALPAEISGRIVNVKNFGYVFLESRTPVLPATTT
jgi:DNA-binding response OmpR family regulator